MKMMPRKFYLGDDFFDDFFEPAVKEQMKCDIYEKDGNYHIIMDVPGYQKENITIECDNGYLTIKGETKKEDNEEKKNYIRRERRYSKFDRSFYVGEVNTDAIKASIENGMLKICVPKIEEKPTKKQISID